MMQPGFAEHFAREWVAAWNSHDLERVLESPIIVTLMGEPSGKLKGKAAVGAYWAKALKALPGLHFGPGGKVRAAFAHYAEWSA